MLSSYLLYGYRNSGHPVHEFVSLVSLPGLHFRNLILLVGSSSMRFVNLLSFLTRVLVTGLVCLTRYKKSSIWFGSGQDNQIREDIRLKTDDECFRPFEACGCKMRSLNDIMLLSGLTGRNHDGVYLDLIRFAIVCQPGENN